MVLRSKTTHSSHSSLSADSLLESLRSIPPSKKLTANQNQVQKKALTFLLSVSSEASGKTKSEYEKSATYISRLFAVGFEQNHNDQILNLLTASGKILLHEIDLCIQNEFPAAAENLHKCSYSDIEKKYKKFQNSNQPDIIRSNAQNIVGAALNRHDLRLADSIASEALHYFNTLYLHQDSSIRDNIPTIISAAINKGNVEKVVTRIIGEYESARSLLESSDSEIVRKYASSLLSAGMARGSPSSSIDFSKELGSLYEEFRNNPSLIIKRHSSTLTGIAIRKFSSSFAKRFAKEVSEKYSVCCSIPYSYYAISVGISKEDLKKSDQIMNEAAILDKELKESSDQIHRLFRKEIVLMILKSSKTELGNITQRAKSLYDLISVTENPTIKKKKRKLVSLDIKYPGYAQKIMTFYSNLKKHPLSLISSNADFIFSRCISNPHSYNRIWNLINSDGFNEVCTSYLSTNGNEKLFFLIIIKCSFERKCDLNLLKSILNEIQTVMTSYEQNYDKENLNNMILLALQRSKNLSQFNQKFLQIVREVGFLIAEINKEQNLKDFTTAIINKALNLGVIKIPTTNVLLKLMGYKKKSTRKLSTNKITEKINLADYVTNHKNPIISKNAAYILKNKKSNSPAKLISYTNELIAEYDRLCSDSSKLIRTFAAGIISYYLYLENSTIISIKLMVENTFDSLNLHSDQIVRDNSLLLLFITLHFKKLGLTNSLANEFQKIYRGLSKLKNPIIAENADSLARVLLRYEGKKILDSISNKNEIKLDFLKKLTDPKYQKIYTYLLQSENVILNQNASEILYIVTLSEKFDYKTVIKLYHNYKLYKKPINELVKLIKKN